MKREVLLSAAGLMLFAIICMAFGFIFFPTGCCQCHGGEPESKASVRAALALAAAARQTEQRKVAEPKPDGGDPFAPLNHNRPVSIKCDCGCCKTGVCNCTNCPDKDCPYKKSAKKGCGCGCETSGKCDCVECPAGLNCGRLKYTQAYYKAITDSRPLIVWVGQPISDECLKECRDMAVCREDNYPEVKGPCVVVGLHHKGKIYEKAVIQGKASVSAIKGALQVSQRAPELVPQQAYYQPSIYQAPMSFGGGMMMGMGGGGGACRGGG